MKVLFVVTAFYPEQAIGSIRITKFAKFLQKHGVSVSVISQQPPRWSSKDESIYFSGLKTMDWNVIDHSWIFKSIFQKMRVKTIGTGPGNAGAASVNYLTYFKVRIRSFAQFIYTLLKAFDWSVRVHKHAQNKLLGKSFDFIFCSYPSFASPISGIKLKKLGIGKNLMVDFRDPIQTKNNSYFSLKNLLQSYILKNSDLNSCVSKGVLDKININYKNSQYLIAPNGYDIKDAEYIKSYENKDHTNNILKFVYTGAIYSGKRDLRPFFQSISNILANSNHSQDQVSLEYAGKEGDIFLSQAREFGMHNQVINHGQLTRSKSLSLQKNSDICLLATWNSSADQGALTGKIFEYFMFRKPILAIVKGDLINSEISKIISDTGAGHCYEAAAKNSNKDLEIWLDKALDQKITSGVIKNGYNENIKKYSIEEVVKTICAKMKELLKEQTL